jgi:hypothetical protein
VFAVVGRLPLEMRGDGAVHRAIMTVWREHFDPPALDAAE